MEDLKRSGKPFYWIGHDKLARLKELCENSRHEDTRKMAQEALTEYRSLIEFYNQQSKAKITDIFPEKSTIEDSTRRSVTQQHLQQPQIIRGDVNSDQTVNITFADRTLATTTRHEDSNEATKRSQAIYQPRKGQNSPSPGRLPWQVQSFLPKKIMIKDVAKLQKIKSLLSAKRPSKQTISQYNQDYLRQQSRERSSPNPYPDTFLRRTSSPKNAKQIYSS